MTYAILIWLVIGAATAAWWFGAFIADMGAGVEWQVWVVVVAIMSLVVVTGPVCLVAVVIGRLFGRID